MKTMVLCHAMPEKRRPIWRNVMQDVAGGAQKRDQELVTVTRGTLRHAESALRSLNAADYYHNNGAAEAEIVDALQDSTVDAS